MNCYNHPYENAVAYCPDCGKSLCHSCAHVFQFPICSTCNANRKKKIFLEHSKSLFVGLLFFAIGCSASLIFGYIFMATYFGWQFLRRRFPSFLLIGSLRTVLIYSLLKIIITAIVGLVITPFCIIRSIVMIMKSFLK